MHVLFAGFINKSYVHLFYIESSRNDALVQSHAITNTLKVSLHSHKQHVGTARGLSEPGEVTHT